MVRTDWDRILSVRVESLTDDEIEDLLPTLIRCDVDDIEDENNLRALVKLSQEMLRHKDNQVESLLLECEEFKEKMSSAQTAPSQTSKTAVTEEIAVDNSDVRKTTDFHENVHYEEAIRSKNDKIETLMDELEGLEEENDSLKRKLEVCREEMEDATENMDAMTEELEQLSGKCNSYKEEVEELQKEKAALIDEIDELRARQDENDKIIEEFRGAIDERENEWKELMGEKDAAIEDLKKELSHAPEQRRESDSSVVMQLNEEIGEKEKIIVDLQEKLLEAAHEINESAALIEKLKNDAKKLRKTGRRREQRDLLGKVQSANEKITSLEKCLRQTEAEATLKSEQLCQLLGDLKKYEDKDRGLADTIREANDLREKLQLKQNHVRDLINVINNLEMLNSCREMQILALREKLGMPEDEEISIEGIALKSQEDSREKDELIRKNQALIQENFDMKSEIRTLRYKLGKLKDKTTEILDSNEIDPDKILKFRGISEEDISSLRERAELDRVQEEVQIVTEENEALRKGMHEILDSIHAQDGKSAVEVHSGTLERLLEALDVRHIAGWYHPAMRMQERLNFIEGRNTELRSQLKELRKELRKKDSQLRKLVPKVDKSRDEMDPGKENETSDSEVEKIQAEKCLDRGESEKERENLNQANEELRETIGELTEQLRVFEADIKVIEAGEDETKKAFATKSREYAEAIAEAVAAKRKCATLENLVNEESAKLYGLHKESIDRENSLRRHVNEIEKRNKMLNNEIVALKSNLCNSIGLIEYNELKEKLEESSVRLRAIYELREAERSAEESLSLPDEKKADGKIPGNDSDTEIKRLIDANLELRQQVRNLQKELSELPKVPEISVEPSNPEKENYEEKIHILTTEKEHLERSLEMSQEESRMHCMTNSLRIFELDSLRHQILDLHAVTDDKETIARLGFELNNCKSSQAELSQRKEQLEKEVLYLRRDLEGSNEKLDEATGKLQDLQNICSTRCRCYEDAIGFLRRQYASSTSLTSLERYEAMLKHVIDKRAEIDRKNSEANELRENAAMQQQLLSDRLAIVEKLKDILEGQIGSGNVENFVQSFSENSQYTLNDIRLKRRISQLENQVKILQEKVSENETTIVSMECEMINVQKIWWKKPETTWSDSERRNETKVEKKTISTQARVECQSREVQSDLCEPGVEKPEVATKSQEAVTKLPEVVAKSPEVMIKSPEVVTESLEISVMEDEKMDTEALSMIKEQLNEALALAAERAAILMKNESEMAEYRAKILSLEKAANFVVRPAEISPERKGSESHREPSGDHGAALKSTITSLQKLIEQKEETITRYQNLLKADRDDHSKAAAQFQQEIKMLRQEMSSMQDEAEKKREASVLGLSSRVTPEEPVKERSAPPEVEEQIARLCEKSSTLEAELEIAKELGDRWNRLAQERLQHMDRMRERLEEQHKNELESYRVELNKWQSEAEALRQQLSENRMQLARGNISLVKELQERDNRIDELTVAYQQLQSEFETMMETTLSHKTLPVSENSGSRTMREMALAREQSNQTELDHLRRQIKAQNERERTYKDQITDLKQQLGRRYMAIKGEERRISNRESQLEKKLKSLEEELQRARVELDREYRVREAKRIKTAEELALWEKQKKWQRIAEKLKKEIKEKIDENKKLNESFEKLRSVVSCMEREKWYLRSKLRMESESLATGLVANDLRSKIVENLQTECQNLRDRLKEATDRLDSANNPRTIQQLEQQRNRIAALEALSEGNTFVIDRLEKLESAKGTLEKTNIRLESENFELRMEIEKRNLDTPRLRDKIEHLEKYIELLKADKSSESSPRPIDKDSPTERKKSTSELEKTVFMLKRVVEKLQVENKRLKESLTSGKCAIKSNRSIHVESNSSTLKKHHELAQKRIIALETDLQLAEQRIMMLEKSRREEDNTGEIGVLRQQLAHKSQLLDRVKQLLTRAAMNEKALRQRIHQIESKQRLSAIVETSPTSSPVHQ